MKIGILTISKSELSFGANLQCYALWKYLSSFENIDCEVIDLTRPCQWAYRTPKIKFPEEQLKNRLILKDRIKVLISRLRGRFRHSEKFKRFWDLTKFSKTIGIDQLYAGNLFYDVIIAGSDQIWNFGMLFYNTPFFLNFPFNGKKISYASSLSSCKLAELHKAEIKKYLSSFHRISVRENDAKNWLMENTGFPISCCVDPVFLLGQDEWSKLSSNKIYQGEYILVFYMGSSESFYSELEKMQEFLNLKIITLKCKNKSCLDNVANAGPIEFLSLIQHAEMVITNSFHCLAFSIIFQKKMLALKTKGNSSTFSRIETLLERAGLENQLVEENSLRSFDLNNLKTSNGIKLKNDIKFSKDFLTEALFS